MFKIKRFFQLHILWPLHRAKYGWAHNDVWSFNDHLTDVIIGGLQELISMGHSFPSKYESFSNPTKVWHDELKSIINAFEERRKFEDYMWDEHKKLEAKYNGKIPAAARMRYDKRMEEEYKDIQTQMHKLIDVFDNLWD